MHPSRYTQLVDSQVEERSPDELVTIVDREVESLMPESARGWCPAARAQTTCDGRWSALGSHSTKFRLRRPKPTVPV
jgi:hypothetical protein